jgi:hypothetical protein
VGDALPVRLTPLLYGAVAIDRNDCRVAERVTAHSEAILHLHERDMARETAFRKVPPVFRQRLEKASFQKADLSGLGGRLALVLFEWNSKG